MRRLTILIDNGHGCNTKGKRSPQGGRLLEWQYTRDIADRILRDVCRNMENVTAVLVVPEQTDVPLRERARRVNEYIAKHSDELCVFYSIHGNAAGDGKEWKSARGWECFTTRGQNNSDLLATLLYEEIEKCLPDCRLRKDLADGDDDKEADFTVIKLANCPAVLSENLFYDNRKDFALMLSDDVKDRIAKAHIAAAVRYWEQKQ